MTNQDQKHSNRWIFLLILIAVVLWIGSIILRLITPATKQVVVPTTSYITTNFDNTKTTYQDLSFTGEKISVPTVFSIAKFQNVNNINEQTVVNSLISQYNLKLSPFGRGIWDGSQYNLVLDPDNHKYYLHKVFPLGGQPPVPTRITDFTAATNTAQHFIDSLLPGLNLKPNQDSYSYYTDGVETTEVPKDQAELVKIKFYYLIDNIPILYAKKSNQSFDVTVDAQNVVRGMTFYPQFINFQVVGQKPSISLEQAIANIKNGSSSIVNVQNSSTTTALESLSNVVLTSVVLEYRADDANQLVYPFYHFSGKATNKLGDHLDIQVITPAVATTVATTP